jgi:hypothetical protein
VFAVLGDPARERRWRPEVKVFEPTAPLAAGTVIRQRIAGPGGSAIPADVRLTTYDPPRRYRFQVVAGPVRPVGDYRLVTASGGTDLTFTLSAELRGIRALVLGRAVQRSIDGEMDNLDRLKVLVEQSA